MKPLNKERFIVFLLSLCLILSVIGSGMAQDKAPVTIKFLNWVSQEDGTREPIAAAIAAFEKAYPWITVENIAVPVSDNVKELTIMSAGGNPPDVAQIHSDNIPVLAASGFLSPILECVPSTLLQDVGQTNMDNAGMYEGINYAAPWADSASGFWYNKVLMTQLGLDPNKPPKTIDEMMEMMSLAKEKLGDDVALLGLDTTVRTIGFYHAYGFLLAFNDGVHPIEGNNINFKSMGVKDYFQWIRDVVAKGYVLPGLRYGQFRPYQADNRCLFAYDSPSNVATILSLNPELTKEQVFENWGMTTLPAGKNGISYSAAQFHSLAVFQGSQHKEEAGLLVDFLVSSIEGNRAYQLPIGWPTSSKSAMDSIEEFSSNPFLKIYADQVQPTFVSLPTGPDYAEACTIIQTGVQEAYTTDKPIEDIIDSVQRQLEALYN